MGVIIRTAAEGASEEALTKDLENLQRQWEQIESKRKEFLHGKRPKLLQGEPDVAIRVVRDTDSPTKTSHPRMASPRGARGSMPRCSPAWARW